MKKTNESIHLCFSDEDCDTLLSYKLTSVPLREDAVLRLGMEFFADPEPCMIHRSAVMSRIYMEMLEYFLHNLDSGKCCHLISQLPERLASFIDIGGCYCVTAKLAEKSKNH